MTSVDVMGMTASIASLVLAVIAIWLSVVFFRMSSQLSESTKEAAKGIGASVERLEKLFDKLYSDTFSMMRDTVTDMRKHIWPDEPSESDKLAEEAERRADEKVNHLKESIDSDLGIILKRQRVQDVQMTELRDEMQSLIERAIASSRQLENEAREETLREHIMRAIRLLRRRKSRVTADDLISFLDFPPRRVVRELERMKAEEYISLSDPDINPDTVISIGRRYRMRQSDSFK